MDLQEALLFTVLPCVDDEAELPLVLQQLRQRRLKEARAALETWLASSLLQQRQGKEATKSSADVGSPGQKREVDVPSARPKTGARPSPRCSVTSPCSDPELEVTWTWTSTGSARRPWGGCRPAGGVELKEVTSMRNAGGRGHAECRCPSVHRFDFESEDAVVDAVEHRRSEVHVDAGVDAPGMRAQHKQLRIEGECLDHPYFPSHVFLSNRCHERTGGAGASGVQAQETCANQHCTIAQEALMRQDEEDSPNCTDAHAAKMQSHEHAAHSVQGVQVEGTPSIGRGQVVSTTGSISAAKGWQALQDGTFSEQRHAFHGSVQSMSAGSHGVCCDVASGVGDDIATTSQECQSDNREDPMSGPSTSNAREGVFAIATDDVLSKRVRIYSRPSIVEGQRCVDAQYLSCGDHSASKCEGAGTSAKQQHGTGAEAASTREEDYGEEGLAEGLAPSRFRQADKPITGERPMSFDLPGLVAEEPGAEPDAMLLVPGGRGGLRHHRTSSREGGRERSLSSAPTTSPVSTAADADQVDEKAESPDGAGRATPEVLEAPVPAGEATASADLWPWPNPRAPHARRASTGAVRPRPQALELDLEAPRTGSEPRRRAGSEELWRPVASTPGRRHSGPSRVEGNVAQKVAVYEAFRKSSPRRAASEASAGSGSSGGSGRSGRGGSGGGAEEASAPGSPTERSKQWVLDCLVDAGALQVLQMGEREEAEQGQFGRETMELEPVGKTWTGSSMRSDEASTPSHPVGSPEMILKLQEQLRLQSSKFQSENEERKELELRLQQHEEALDALRHLEAQLGPKKEKEEAGVEATKEQKETEDKRKEKAEKQKAFAQKKAEEAPKEEAKKEMEEKEKKEEKSQQKGKCQDKGSKGKGKGNPPKGKGKGEGSVEPRMPEVPLKIAMKKLFWNPLKLGKTASVWERIYERYAERMQHPDFDPTTGSHFDRMELEAHFAEALGGSSPQKTRASLAPLTNHRRVLEEKRRRELWFMLALMPGSDQLLRAVAYMDDEILKPDKVELLQMNLPTAADVELIETSLMNSPLAEGETWDVPEEFALSISKIPQYATRVKMWSFLNSVGAAIARLRLAQKELFEAAKVLLTSESLEKILGLVLFVGNYLNGGTARGRADGFDLEALPKLAKLRGRGHDTLLDFLVSQAERACLVQLFEPDRELEVLRRARAHAVADAVEETKSWISQAEGFLPHEAPSEAPMRMRQEQVQKSLGELQEVLATFGEWQEKYEELCQWFQMQDVRQRPSEEFFSLWESFLSDLKRAWEGYQRAQEAKTPRRSKSLPPRRRSAPILSAPHGVQGSKTPCSSPRFAGGNCDVRYVRYPRRRTAIGSASWADPPEGLAGLTGLAEKEPA
ncbi:unnamed protein product [Durusdinium trenchii]|uniref:FH2 domain-containing protein n=1 Tax=Durusdinium trenchii TaxID=1381693 RepID=A0ABP0NES2_9DINO